VLRLSGQDAQWKHLRRAKASEWSKLTPAQRGQLMWAADALDWGWVEDVAAAAGAPPAGALIWQITEPLPQLSEEPLCKRGPAEGAAALRRLVADEEAALSRALAAGQAAAAAQLAPLAELTVADAARRLRELREVLQGVLGLSTGGRAKRGQEVRRARAGYRRRGGQAGAGCGRRAPPASAARAARLPKSRAGAPLTQTPSRFKRPAAAADGAAARPRADAGVGGGEAAQGGGAGGARRRGGAVGP
jgi:hypothetical protein